MTARAGAIVVACLLPLAACDGHRASLRATGGDAVHGREVIAAYNCGACHAIPGVTGARGVVGPPLEGFGARTFVAGVLPNTADNVVRWVRDPRAIEPRTAMPVLGLDEREARDVAAYLYELR